MTNISDVLASSDVLRELIALEGQTLEAYEAAADQLDELETQVAVESFHAEHRRHTRELRAMLEQRQSLVPHLADAAEMLPVVNSMLDQRPGDRAVLQRLRNSENRLEAAYVNLLKRGDLEPRLRAALERILADERRCTAWIDDRLLADVNRG